MRHSIYKHHRAPCFDSITQAERGRSLKRTSVILKRHFRRSHRPFQRLDSIAARSTVKWDPEYANSIRVKTVRELGSCQLKDVVFCVRWRGGDAGGVLDYRRRRRDPAAAYRNVFQVPSTLLTRPFHELCAPGMVQGGLKVVLKKHILMTLMVWW